MKTTLHNVIAFLSVLVLFTCCGMSECDYDDINCYNDGVCVEGACDCEGLWEGRHCDVPSVYKYITSSATISSDSCGAFPGSNARILLSSASGFRIIGFLNDTLSATLADTKHFHISEQILNDSISIVGSGLYKANGGEVRINYTRTNVYTADSTFCSVSLIP
jgi:hypothetical protein